MNVERLHAIANAIQKELRQTNSVKILQQLFTALQNQVTQPQLAEYQNRVAEQLSKLVEALADAPSNQFPPTWRQAIEELGTDHLLGNALAERINEVFARNQITPAVAQQEVQSIHKQLAAFETTIDQLVAAFGALNIGAEELAPGTAELGVLVPRDFVHNELDEFAEELQELDDIFGVFAEVASGNRPGFQIDSISSSQLSVFLALTPAVAACIATAVEKVVALYKQLLEIRKLHGELRKQGVPDTSLKGIEDHANTFRIRISRQCAPRSWINSIKTVMPEGVMSFRLNYAIRCEKSQIELTAALILRFAWNR